MVLKSLFTADLDRINRIPTEIPTEILFKFFTPGRERTPDEEKNWAAKISALPNRDAVETAVKLRQEIITKARNGQMSDINDFRAVVSGMGILVTRIGLSNIEPTGKTAESVDKLAVAELSRQQAEVDARTRNIEAQQFRDEVRKMTPIVGDGKEARRAVSVRQKFTEEKVEEKQVSISPDMTTAFERLGTLLLEKLLGRKEDNCDTDTGSPSSKLPQA